ERDAELCAGCRERAERIDEQFEACLPVRIRNLVAGKHADLVRPDRRGMLDGALKPRHGKRAYLLVGIVDRLVVRGESKNRDATLGSGPGERARVLDRRSRVQCASIVRLSDEVDAVVAELPGKLDRADRVEPG